MVTSDSEGWSLKVRSVEVDGSIGYYPRFRMARFAAFLDRNYYRLDRKYCCLVRYYCLLVRNNSGLRRRSVSRCLKEFLRFFLVRDYCGLVRDYCSERPNS